MSWLDSFFAGVKTVQTGGVAVPARGVLNLIGFTVADNPTNGRTDVTSVAASGGVQGTTAVTISSASTTVDSAQLAPAGSVVDSISYDLATLFTAGNTASVGTPAAPAAFLATTDTKIDTTGALGMKTIPIRFVALGNSAIRVVRAGTSGVGSMTFYVHWFVPQT